MHPHHHHHRSGTGKVLIISLAATVLFVLAEAWAGVQAQSLALLSDAGHNFTDALALLLALFGVYLQNKPANERKTFGYHRGGVLAAFVNALTLVVLSLYLFYESYRRLIHPQPVEEGIMVAVAGLGLILNSAILLGLRRGEGKHDLNIRAASVHMLGDALGSVAIIIGAVVIYYTAWYSIDAMLSFLISGLIVWTAVDIVRESLDILLEGMPRGLHLKNVIGAMRDVPGVIDVHDLHVWSIGSNTRALSCHCLIEDVPPSVSDVILQGINGVLAESFHIHHTTVQFEHVRCANSDGPCTIVGHEAHGHAVRPRQRDRSGDI